MHSKLLFPQIVLTKRFGMVIAILEYGGLDRQSGCWLGWGGYTVKNSMLFIARKDRLERFRKKKRSRFKRLRIETLEDRHLLAVVSWDGGGDGTSWNDRLNWDSDVLPMVSDDVEIFVANNAVVHIENANVEINSLKSDGKIIVDGATLTLVSESQINNGLEVLGGEIVGMGDLIVANFKMTGGQLIGSASVTVTGNTAWSGGAFSGTGEFNAQGGLAISGRPQLEGFTLNNAGIAIYAGDYFDQLTIKDSGVINNLSGAVFELQVEGYSINADGVGGEEGFFNNYGTLRKSIGDEITTITASFNNSGKVEVQTGTLDFRGDSEGTGRVNVAPNATLKFSDFKRHVFHPDAVIEGSGELLVSSGTVDFQGERFSIRKVHLDGGELLLNSGSEVEIQYFDISSGGALGGIDDVTVLEAMQWSDGAIGGAGQLNIHRSLNLSGGIAQIDTKTVNNYGVASQAGEGFDGLYIFSGGTFNNMEGASYRLSDSGYAITDGFDGLGGSFNNYGTLLATESDESSIVELVLNNFGTLLVEKGTLELRGGGATHGETVVAEDATLLISTTPFGFDEGYGVRGSGTLVFSGVGYDSSPQKLEVMSRDDGVVPFDFERGFAIGQVVIRDGSYVQLVDNTDNAFAETAEAIYVNTLVVDEISVLDTQGYPVYSRQSRVDGDIIGHQLTPIFDGGALRFGVQTPGAVEAIGEVDEWEFLVRLADIGVTIEVDPGSEESVFPVEPTIGYVKVEVLDPVGNVIASETSHNIGETVTLRGIQFTRTGTHKIRISAPTAQPDLRGNYAVTAWEAGNHASPLVLGQQHYGGLGSIYGVDRWSFSASADQQIQLRSLAMSSPDLRYRLLGPDEWVGFNDLADDSELVNLPSSGDYVLEVYSAGKSSPQYSFQLVESTPSSLTLGVPYTGTLNGNGEARIFRLEVGESTPLLITLDGLNDSDRNELYVRFDEPPTRELSQYRAAIAGQSDQQIVIPSASPGIWYILLYTNSSGEGSGFELLATASNLLVNNVFPISHGNASEFLLTVDGAGFDDSTTVQLIDSSGKQFDGSLKPILTSQRMQAVFPAQSLASGVYDVQVQRGASEPITLKNSINIVDGGETDFTAQVIAPSSFVIQRIPATLFVEYANHGTVSMAAPLLQLTSNPKAFLSPREDYLSNAVWTNSHPYSFGDSVTILASGKVPGILGPGETVRVPIYGVGIQDLADAQSFGSIRFALTSSTVDDQIPANWTESKDDLRPATISIDGWEAIWDTLIEQVGETNGDYVRMLNENAAYLGSLGLNVTDVGELWDFEIRQAYGFGQFSLLEPLTDPRLVTPGLSLQIERYYSGCVLGRYENGPLGRGWFHNWDIHLEVEPDETVIVVGDRGVRRVFQPSFGSISEEPYLSEVGDPGQLRHMYDGTFQLTELDGKVLTFSDEGRFLSVEDANGNRIEASYSDQGWLSRLEHSAGPWINLTNNSIGQIILIQDSLGNETLLGYERSLLTSVTDPSGRTTQYDYQSSVQANLDLAMTAIHTEGGSQFIEYDQKGRVARITRDDGALPTIYSYDTTGRVSVSDALGNQTHSYYDPRSLEVATQDSLGNITRYFYDDGGRLSDVVDSRGQTISYRNDSFGNLREIQNRNGDVSYYNYGGPFRQLSEAIDADGNETRLHYDADGNLLRYYWPDGSAIVYNYDTNGSLVSIVNASGKETSLERDEMGRVVREDTESTTKQFSYDSSGRITSLIGNEGVTAFEYDDADRLIAVRYPNGRYLEYTYDAAGRRKSMLDHDGFELDYTYDAIGQLTELRDGTNRLIVSYDYDVAGNMTRKTLGNGTSTTFDFDSLGRISRMINFASDQSINSFYEYAYDNVALRTTMTSQDGQWTYQFDPIGQLTEAVFAPSRAGVDPHEFRYAYDKTGNRIEAIHNGVTVTYTSNNLSQYSQIGEKVNKFDADGNLIESSDTSGTSHYTYGDDGRLKQVMTPEGQWSYEYDTMGNRIATTHNGMRTEYLIDPFGYGDAIAEYDVDGNLVARNIVGIGLTMRQTMSGDYYYDFDEIGSVVGMTGDDGSYVNQYRYDPFGQLINSSVTVSNPFEFVGFDGITAEQNGLHFMRNRFYQAGFGNFTSRDLISESGENPYYYVTNNPLQFLDPTGLKPKFKTDEDSVAKWIRDKIRGVTGPQGPRPAGNMGVRGDNRSSGGGSFGGSGSAADHQDNKDPKKDQKDCKDCNPEDEVNPNLASAGDPNHKFGPTGFGDANFDDGGLLAYHVEFENESDATSAAKRVTVRDVLSEHLDVESLEFTGIGFGSTVIAISSASQHFETTVEMTQGDQEFDVKIKLTYIPQRREIYAVFQSIDPSTSLPPSGLAGFLPPEDGTRRGIGYFTYTVRPAAGLPTGTEIRNVATITFDEGEVIDTNQVDPHDPLQGTDPSLEALVTIDAAPPTSVVTSLPEAFGTANFMIEWTGQDDVGGSGVGSYDVYVSKDDGPFQLAIANIRETNFEFTGESGSTYAFFSVARDNVGHVEAMKATADTETLVIVGAWVNRDNIYDVDNSGYVSALDALIIINELNFHRVSDPNTSLLPPLPPDGFAPPFYDVSEDGRVTALDALHIINELNRQYSFFRSSSGSAGLAWVSSSDTTESVGVSSAAYGQPHFERKEFLKTTQSESFLQIINEVDYLFSEFSNLNTSGTNSDLGIDAIIRLLADDGTRFCHPAIEPTVG